MDSTSNDLTAKTKSFNMKVRTNLVSHDLFLMQNLLICVRLMIEKGDKQGARILKELHYAPTELRERIYYICDELERTRHVIEMGIPADEFNWHGGY
jgi:hypothetical protein